MNKRIDPNEFFEIAKETATNYGLISIKDLVIKNAPKKRVKVLQKLQEKDTIKTNLGSLLKIYIENKHVERPCFTYFSNIDKETKPLISSSVKQNDACFSISALGIDDPFSEALLLNCAKSILNRLDKDSGPYTVKLNSIGDVASAQKYCKGLNEAFRRHIDMADENCIGVYKKKSVLKLHEYIHKSDSCAELRSVLPTHFKFFSQTSQQHLEKVLEYLDTQNLNYSLAYHLMEDSAHCEHTIFSLEDKDGNVRATGARYNRLGKYLFGKDGEVPVVSLRIKIPSKTRGAYTPKQKRNIKPKVFLLHSTYKARLKTLPILENLNKENVRIDHKLYHKSVESQLEETGGKYAFRLIIGHPEALDNTARIINMKTMEQTVMPIEKVPLYLRRKKVR